MYFKEDLTPEDRLDNELVKWTIMKGPCRYSTLLGEHGQEGAPEDFKEWGFRKSAPRNTLVLRRIKGHGVRRMFIIKGYKYLFIMNRLFGVFVNFFLNLNDACNWILLNLKQWMEH